MVLRSTSLFTGAQFPPLIQNRMLFDIITAEMFAIWYGRKKTNSSLQTDGTYNFRRKGIKKKNLLSESSKH